MIEVKQLFFDDAVLVQNLPKVSIGVHFHVFYADLLSEFAEALNNIPVTFDCFVSIPLNSTCTVADVKNHLSPIKHLGKLAIVRTPNKGRDIAPMICTFGKELGNYSVILHIHTKKSPHDKAQDGWRQYILQHLLANEHIVANILCWLSKDVGMLAASDFLCNSSISGWCHKGNKSHAISILKRSYLNIDLEKDYKTIDFPQGSMFWARTDYLKSMFEFGFTYGDFDDEPIPVDGTFVHALERLFFLWGKDTGLYPAKLYVSKSELLIHQYSTIAIGDLLERRDTLTLKCRRLRRRVKLLALLLSLAIIYTTAIFIVGRH